MFKFLPKFLVAFSFWGIFIYVVLNISYPKSLTEATLFQLLSFFIPLFLALIFTANILLNIVFSIIISLGLILLLILKGFDLLNIVTGIITLVIVGLLLSYFKKTADGFSIKKGLSFKSPIPKLRLSNKFKQAKLTYSRRRKR